MDNDLIRRGKPSTHIKFGESTAVLAGNSLLTMAFEILSHKDLNISEKTKNKLINKISESSGHLGIAGGQYLDLSYEHKKVSKKRVIEMEIKKTGKLFSFCCVAPLIIRKKSKKEISKFENLGADIGLLFQVADDLIDYKGSSLVAGKKTGKDKNLPNNYNALSLEELTNEANKMIQDLESQKDLGSSMEKYQNLLKLNNIIEKKFQKDVKDINEKTKENILKITSKKKCKYN
jgi:geranylgeranyl pyrophosphate synthase